MRVSFFLAASGLLWAQAPIIQSRDAINLRNIAMTADGSTLVYAAALNRIARPEGVTNLYGVALGPNPVTTRLTNYQGDDPLSGVMALDIAAAGRIVYTVLANFITQEEEIRIIDGDRDRVVATDKEGCVRVLCVNCYSLCVRNVHITSDGNTVLYAAARDFPFYTVAVNGSTRRKIETVYQGALAPSAQRVISQAGKVVFTSSAPYGPTFAPAATDVYTMNLDGTGIQQVTRLSPVTVFASDAVIAANGSWIAFVRTEAQTTQIWIVRPDGTGLRRLSDGSASATSPSISADGNSVTFVQSGQVKVVGTLLDPLALPFAAEVTRFAVSAAQGPVLSADGSRVAFLLGPPDGLPAAIYTAPVTGGLRFEQLTQVYAPRMLFPAGLVSAGGSAAPSVGSLMTAYGANLSREEFSTAGALPLPTKLGGVELLANLEAMPLQAVTPWQINAQLAGSRIPGGVSFRVREGAELTDSAVKLVVASAPEAIPMPAVSPPGQLLAAVVLAGTRTLADAAHPATSGELLEIYCFGLGETIPAVEVGAASPIPPAQAKIQPRVQIGGREAVVTFAGLVPGLAGVYQVNVRVPAGAGSGYQPLRWIATDGSVSGTSGIFVR